MFFDIMLYPERVGNKEQAKRNTGKIKKKILDHPVCMDIKQIAEEITTGNKAVCFAHAEDTLRNKALDGTCWKSQQLYALDFDNAMKKKKFTEPYYMTIEDALSYVRNKGYEPAIIYKTSSHSEDHHKFRMVFAMDRKITRTLEDRKIQKALIAMTSVQGKAVVDTSCSDPCRIFYPGTETVYINEKAVVDSKKLIREYGSIKTDEIEDSIKHEIKYGPDDSIVEAIVEDIKETAKRSKLQSGFASSPCGSKLQRVRGKRDTEYIYIIDLLRPFFKNPVIPWESKAETTFEMQVGSLDMAEILQKPSGKVFGCILPGHNDKHGSAVISYDPKDGICKYHCFACNKTYNIIELFRVLSGETRINVMKWLSKMTGLKYETSWQTETKEKLLDYQDYLMMNLEKDYPVLYKRLVQGNHTAVLNMIIHLGRVHLQDKDIIGYDKPVFYHGRKYFYEKAKYFGITKSDRKLYDSIKYLAHLGLIKILTFEEIPTKMKKIVLKGKKDKKNLMSVYEIPEYSFEFLNSVQEKVLEDRQKGFRMKAMKHETIARMEGKDEVYTQATKELSEKTECFYQKYKKAANGLIDKKGWTTEEEILKRIKGFSEREKKRQSEICLPQLIKEENLKRKGFSKELEKKYNIRFRKKKPYGNTKIIIRG